MGSSFTSSEAGFTSSEAGFTSFEAGFISFEAASEVDLISFSSRRFYDLKCNFLESKFALTWNFQSQMEHSKNTDNERQVPIEQK